MRAEKQEEYAVHLSGDELKTVVQALRVASRDRTYDSDLRLEMSRIADVIGYYAPFSRVFEPVQSASQEDQQG